MWNIAGHFTSTGIIPNPVYTGAITPLFDLYSNALAGYSFRKLNSSYAGSSVRLRRDSDDTEQDIGFSGNDFDSAAAATFLSGANGFIVKWYDQSGNGYNILQTDAQFQPLYKVNAFGSLPSAYYTTESIYEGQLWTTTDSVVFSGGNVACLSLVGALNSSAGGFASATSLHANGASYYGAGSLAFFGNYTTPVRRTIATNGVFATSADAATVGVGYTWIGDWNGTNEKLYQNAVEIATNNVSANIGSASNSTLKVFTASGSARFKGRIAEVVYWTVSQRANIAGINTNQSTYWGV